MFIDQSNDKEDQLKTHTIKGLSKPASVIGLGTMIFHPQTKKRDFSLLDSFVENGGTYVDTAEVYGAVEEHGYSEKVIVEWLTLRPGIRDEIILASKGLIPGYCAPIHPGGAKINPDSIHKAIDGSLRRLRTDYLDTWMFHGDDPKQPVVPLIDALDEELRSGLIKAYGASNWSTARIQAAIDYARTRGKAEIMSSSPNFSLTLANEPFWPDTVVTDAQDRSWFAANNFLVVAWSALARGFFTKGELNDQSDADLVRTFYSDNNFLRKQRAKLMAADKGMSIFEIGLGYVINQGFPVVALTGTSTTEHFVSSARAGDLQLNQAKRDWLDLSSNVKPF